MAYYLIIIIFQNKHSCLLFYIFECEKILGEISLIGISRGYFSPMTKYVAGTISDSLDTYTFFKNSLLLCLCLALFFHSSHKNHNQKEFIILQLSIAHCAGEQYDPQYF